MDVVVERCAAIDIGKDEIVVCARVPAATGRSRRAETRKFKTFMSGLEAAADWLELLEVTAVVMEATGQYWKPVVRHEALF